MDQLRGKLNRDSSSPSPFAKAKAIHGGSNRQLNQPLKIKGSGSFKSQRPNKNDAVEELSEVDEEEEKRMAVAYKEIQ